MNKEEIMAMSPEQLRIEIAKAMGLKLEVALGTTYAVEPCGDHNHVFRFRDPTDDISAAWKMEEDIPVLSRPEYTEILGEMIDVSTFADLDWGLCHASPEQRCRAWLMWKTGESK